MKKLREIIYDIIHRSEAKNKELKGEIYNNTLYTNNYISIIHDCCKISHNGDINKSYEEKRKFISNILGYGHESILEHGYAIQGYILEDTYAKDLLELLNCNHYLFTKVKIKDNVINLIVGGSIRGFKELIRNSSNLNNKIIKTIITRLYDLDPNLFEDFIKDEIMDEEIFKENGSSTLQGLKSEAEDNIIIEGKYVDIINSLGDIKNIYDVVNKYFGRDIFSIEDILDITPITVLFKNVSRSISHELVRHRDGITQQSQRYVDSSNLVFNSPANYKDKYDKEKLYDIKFSDGRYTTAYKFTLQGLGDAMKTIYPQLREQGLDKEDARYYNTNGISTSLYMTFSFKAFIKFLELRTSKAAQPEIRLAAQELETIFKNFIKKSLFNINLLPLDIYDYLKPLYLKGREDENLYEDIDEVIE